jgi:hypothetical protein
LIGGKEGLKEIPRVQRYIGRPSLREIFKGRHGGERSDGKRVYEAYIPYVYMLKEISNYLGVHYTTVSRIVKRIEEMK